MKTTYRVEAECVVERLEHHEICRNASFKLDKAIKIDQNDLLILEDGAWALKTNSVQIPLHGRWVNVR